MNREFMLDKATILDRLGGDEEIFAVMADMYLQDVAGYSEQLAAALAAGDAPVLHREAHTVKGLLATFADEEGAALAMAVEARAKSGDLAGLDGAVADIRERLQQVADALRSETAA